MDSDGNKVGVPIKASDLYNKPTLKYLQEKFKVNETARQPHKVRVKNAIDLALLRNSNHSIQSLGKTIEKEGIVLVFRQNVNGIIYGVTYVDHQTKCVFNGSDLGKQYSANALQERCRAAQVLQPNETAERQSVLKTGHQNRSIQQPEMFVKEPLIGSNLQSPLDNLLQPTQTANYLPHQLKKTKRKKRKRISNNQ